MVNFCGQMDECDPYEFVQSVISVVGAKTFLILG